MDFVWDMTDDAQIWKEEKIVEMIRMKKAIVSLGLIFLVFILFSSAAFAAHDQNGVTISIMTQNMDSGTDLGFVLALGGDTR